MEKKECVILHAPILYMDEREPFSIRKVGYEVYEEDGAGSVSFNRKFDFQNYKGTVKVIEYAYYLDYDIQHLYDLEHIWIYMDEDENMVGAEGSYHGRFLRATAPGFTSVFKKGEMDEEYLIHDGAASRVIYPKGSRLIMYSQPGKHAMLSNPKLMYLYPELFEACDRLCGINGLDAPEKFLKDIHLSQEENRKVARYIKEKFSFEPVMRFQEREINHDDYIPWQELEWEIPGFIKEQLKIILEG
ncbi:hypothetical protein [Butyrivibrio sp. MC2021]|uniref:hypothetical protein n=1 Tax=Butyrivibrio sp. MC2021 TaxID=1408306 RepID=UPI000685E57B|nr:hypothetical protein [Butyrivibrio sp. MC2021]